jgi:prepilin-type N-terminal cleavage/methylation domain-containing protein
MFVDKDCKLASKKVPMSFSRGFSLIELLVVIAIITLLAALLFPVFATAQENSRESSTISHIEQIQSALALYKLDNHAYPQVLFGYAAPGEPMSDSAAVAQSSSSFGSLYPSYISDFHTFTASDNPVDDPTQTVTLDSTELTTCTTPGTAPCTEAGTELQLVPRTFYTMDAFDVSPELAALGTPNQFINGNTGTNLQYVLRYQRDWTAVQPLINPDSTPTTYSEVPYYTSYLNQLRWQNPPADSYVASTTWHIPDANKVIVLFESGTALKIDPTQLNAGYDDSTSCFNTVGGTESCSLNVTNDNPANFWKVANTQ